MVYTLALVVKSFHNCFCYQIVLAEFTPGPPLLLGIVSMRYLCLYCSFNVVETGGFCLEGCHGYPMFLARTDLWPHFSQAPFPKLMSLMGTR